MHPALSFDKQVKTFYFRVSSLYIISPLTPYKERRDMKIEGRPRLWRSKIAVLSFIVLTIVFTLFVAVKAKGIPMIMGYDERFAVPPAITTYSMAPCADFQVVRMFKKVCAGPGSQIPKSGEDNKSFEDNLKLMIVFAGRELPFASWLYVVKPNPDSPEVIVQLFDGEHIYAAGIGETFAVAMDDLRANFEEDRIAPFARVKKKEIGI